MKKLFFELLSNSLFDTPISERGTEPSIDEYVQLYRISKAHDLTHIISLSLDKNGIFPSDPIAAEKFSKQQFLAFYRYEQQNFELASICSVLNNSKIPYLPLKGAIIREYYPEPWMRTSCDIDILVKEEDLKKATDAICGELQYQTDGARDYHDISLYSSSGTHLELHFNILENMENIDRLLSRVWDYCAPIDGTYRYEMTKEYLLFHIISHIAYHFKMGGCGIRSIVDLYLLEQKTELDRDNLEGMLKECKLESFYKNIKSLMSVWFEGAEHDDLTSQMEEYIIFGGAYGSMKASIAAKRAENGGKLGYVFSRIFQPYKVLQNKYPILRRHKWLTPFYQIRRWFSILFSGKTSRAVKELKGNSSVDGDTVKKISELHKNVGL